jgi:periplasmic protein CpxP/Spy
MMKSVQGRFIKRAGSSAAIVFALTTALITQPLLSCSALAQGAPAMSAVPIPQELSDAVEIRIAELHQTLRITPAQEALFRAYADTLRGNAQAINTLFVQRAQTGELSAPAELRWYGQLTAAHAEAINKLIAPFDALYQSLSPGQRAAADRHFEQLRQRRAAQRGR